MNSELENKQKSWDTRQRHLPLPGKEHGYRSILMQGTFGAGKTTTIRQLLGTNPTKEKFPATNPGRTTIADSEYIITSSSSYQSAITFFDLETVKRHLSENLTSTAQAVIKGENDFKLFMRLLDHKAQRFRFSYLFGVPRPEPGVTDPFDLDDEGDDEANVLSPQYRDAIDALKPIISSIKNLSLSAASYAESYARSNSWPETEVQNYIEEQIDIELSRSDLHNEFLDLAIDLMVNRIDAIDYGTYEYDDDGWPVAWTFSSRERSDFISKISPFTSNNKKRFGELIFPLVNGVRVSGPFKPEWADFDYKFVIADTQGLEHAQVGNTQSIEMEKYDVIAVVDNAVQPLLPPPWSVVSYLATTGGVKKLRFLMTHFDAVKGDEGMSPRERGNYVRAHLENKIQENHETIGPVGTRDLNKKVATSTYFLSNLHELFLPDNMEHQRTIRELKRFLLDISNEPDDPVGELPVPVYSRKVLSEAVKSASTGFRQRWLGYLGIESHPNFPKAVWATVKALTRRLAEGWADEHAHLAPIAQFRTEIETSLFRALSSPIRWTTNNASQDERDQVIRGIAAQLGPELRELANHRIAATKRGAWYDAYSQAGTGSAKIRASIIKNDIIDQSSPESSSNQSMDLVNMILKIFEDLGRKGLLFLLD